MLLATGAIHVVSVHAILPPIQNSPFGGVEYKVPPKDYVSEKTNSEDDICQSLITGRVISLPLFPSSSKNKNGIKNKNPQNHCP